MLTIILACGFIFTSCDKEDTPYKDASTIEVQPTDKTRSILIEDYTGHTCGNCPSAAIVAQGLKDTYGDQIIIMGVHAGWFANTKSGPEYTTDFTNTDSEAYDATFGNSTAGNPNGLINRTERSGSLIVQPANWESAILDIKDMEADLSIEIESDYNSTSKQTSISVTTLTFNTLTEDHALVVAFVEDSIVDWQKDYTLPSAEQDIENYTHRHVFRGNINGTWGDDLASASLVQDTEEIHSYSYTPNESWNIDKSYLVAYIYNKDTYEIIQVAETHVSNH